MLNGQIISKIIINNNYYVKKNFNNIEIIIYFI